MWIGNEEKYLQKLSMNLGSTSRMEVPPERGVLTPYSPSQFPGTPAEPSSSSNAYAIAGHPMVQVMTDEQLETLRRQISVYATICQQLVEMHKATVAQQNAISGSRFGQSSSFNSGLQSLGHRFTSRQRWAPSQIQLQILEKVFQEGNGTPSKQKIKEICSELIHYGPISETNVYNWFQNRRARTKRKQQLGALNNTELELEIDANPQLEKRACTEESPSDSIQPKRHLQHWEAVELQKPDATKNGRQCAQMQATDDNPAAPYIKADGESMKLLEEMNSIGKGQTYLNGSSEVYWNHEISGLNGCSSPEFFS